MVEKLKYVGSKKNAGGSGAEASALPPAFFTEFGFK